MCVPVLVFSDGAVTGAANGAETQDKGEQPVAKTSDASFPAGAILHFKGCGGDTSREDIKVSCWN